MRTLRYILVALALLVVLLAGAAWAGPGLLDWNRYRGTIASLASTALGRPVRIDGNVTLQLLPEPVLTASRITVTDEEGGAALSAAQLRLRVGLFPLLSGHVEARELVLAQPRLQLDWPLPSVPARPTWLASLAARIEGGTLIIGSVTVSGIDATINTDGDTGAFGLAGTASLFGLPWHATARLGQPQVDGATTLEATLDGQGAVRDTGGRFSGRVTADGALEGQITGRGPDLSRLLPAPPVAWRADGRLTASGGLAAADELALDIGGSPARGAVALRVGLHPRLDLALAASRLDLDRWLPVLLRGNRAGALETGIDLSAEAATLAGGTLRGLRGAFDLGPDGVEVRDATAILPGEATLRLAGRLNGPTAPAGALNSATAPAGAGQQFDGTAAIGLPDMRTTLHWLQAAGLMIPVTLPPDVLRTAQATARVSANAHMLALTDLAGQLDGTPMSGGAGAGFGPHPELGLTLKLGRLVLDPWLPATLPSLPQIPRLVAGYDLDLHIQTDGADWRGLGIDGFGIDATAKSGRLTVQRIEGTVQGLHLTVAGTLNEAGRLSDGKLTLAAPSATPLAPLLPARWHAPAAALAGPVSLTAQASGTQDALAVQLDAQMNDAQVTAQPLVNLQTGNWAGSITLRHPGATRLLRLLGLGGAPWLGDGSLSLLAQITATPARLSIDNFDLTAGSLRAGGALSIAPGTRTTAGIGPSTVTGHITSDSLALPMPNPRDTTPLPVQLIQDWQGSVRIEAGQVLMDGTPVLQQAAGQLDVAAGQLHISGLTAQLGGGTLHADVHLGATASDSLTVRASLSNLKIATPLLAGLGLAAPWDMTAGTLAGSLDVTAQGFAPSAMMSTLSGAASLTLADGRISGFNMLALRSALDAAGAVDASPATLGRALRPWLTSGTTEATSLSLPLAFGHGAIALDGAALAGPDGTAALSGSLDLGDLAPDLRLSLRPLVDDAPELRLRLDAATGRLAVTPELGDLPRWQTARRAATPAPAASPATSPAPTP